jgi:prepilin-type N-terminal cleavage/methylation domain-containing protein
MSNSTCRLLTQRWRRTTRHDSRDAGFSLIEVIVAMSLFVIAATAGALAILNNQHSSLLSQQKVRAANLAQSYLAAIVPGQPLPTNLASTTSDGYQVDVSFSPSTSTCNMGSTRAVSVLVYAPNAAAGAAPITRADSVVSC